VLSLKVDAELRKQAQRNLDEVLRRICHSLIGFRCSMACKDGIQRCNAPSRIRTTSMSWIRRNRETLEGLAERDEDGWMVRPRL